MHECMHACMDACMHAVSRAMIVEGTQRAMIEKADRETTFYKWQVSAGKHVSIRFDT